MTAEEERLEQARRRAAHWRRWGPYLAERQWGTVREDYSPFGNAWEYFPFDHARSRAYRWGEDGIAGISDNHQRLCFALALWNGQDPFLKERFFGLSGPEGNHGEDVKEYYFYLDNTPTHAYMKLLYKYPHRAFPYAQLAEENRRRGRGAPEVELLDTGVFEADRYFDVFVEYAKQAPDDILIQVSAVNRGPEECTLHLLPTLWLRNTWSWGAGLQKPLLRALPPAGAVDVIEAQHPALGKRWLYCEKPDALLFTENETNFQRLYGVANSRPFVKDGINDHVVLSQRGAVNPDRVGTKASAHYVLKIAPGKVKAVRLRLSDEPSLAQPFGAAFDKSVEQRKREADEFYARVGPDALNDEMRAIQRQAFAGLLWTKQFYHYVVEQWLAGDPAGPAPPPERKRGRNCEWVHVYNDDVLSVPDKWEYPWFAAWDLAFHAVAFAMIDPEFAKRQLDLLTREWYMHPNGQIPAYEWSFGDVNPPVHAWAAWRVYKIDKKLCGCADRQFLERVFQKLLLNFTWWVNRKDAEGKNIFQGGFLGLDNIGVFNRSDQLPTGGHLEQSDGTSWMGMYCLNMLAIACELARENPAYEDIASKFFEHFLYIAHAMNHVGGGDLGLWDEHDGFFYDVLHLPNGRQLPLKIRSMVGLIPLFAVESLEPGLVDALPGFKKRLEWFIRNRPDLAAGVASMEAPGVGKRRLLALVSPEKLRRILVRMLDDAEFLSPYGVRSVSKDHVKNAYVFKIEGQAHRVDYEPAESSGTLFGGNSNWRGPIWFPLNFLLIESLQKFHYYLGDAFKVPCPSGSKQELTLWHVSMDLSHRLLSIFFRGPGGKRPVYNAVEKFQADPNWRDLILFHEYFHGDTGAGLGASHQTGWTALAAKLIQQCGEYCLRKREPELERAAAEPRGALAEAAARRK